MLAKSDRASAGFLKQFAGRLRKSTFVRDSILVFAGAMLVNACNFFYHFLMLRRLTVAGYGALSSVLAIIVVITIPAMVLTTIVTRYSAHFEATGDQPRLRRVADLIFLGTVAAAIPAITASLIFKDWLSAYFHLSDPLLITYAGISIALTIMLFGLRGVLQGAQDFRVYAWSTGVEAAGKVVLGLTFVAAGWDVRGALGGFVLGNALGVLYTLAAMAARYRGPREKLAIDIAQLFATSSGIAASIVAINVLGAFDLLLVKHFFDPVSAGLYAAVNFTGKILFLLVNFLPIVVLPKAASNAARGQAVFPVFLRAATVAVILSVAGILALMIFPAAALLLIGSSRSAALPLVVPYAFAMVILGLIGIVINYKIALHRFDFVIPLLALTILEIAGVSVYHHTLMQVVYILAGGHTLILLTSLYRINISSEGSSPGKHAVRFKNTIRSEAG